MTKFSLLIWYLLKVSYFQNEFMKIKLLSKRTNNCKDFCPVSKGRHPCNFLFVSWEKFYLHKFILKITDLYITSNRQWRFDKFCDLLRNINFTFANCKNRKLPNPYTVWWSIWSVFVTSCRMKMLPVDTTQSRLMNRTFFSRWYKMSWNIFWRKIVIFWLRAYFGLLFLWMPLSILLD